MKNKKLALIILDGLGYGNKDWTDAVNLAKTPCLDTLLKIYPNAKLQASGQAVGLPAGQMGNSEVGHMNLGAGRVVYQQLGRINLSVSSGDLVTDPLLVNAFNEAKKTQKNVHFIGLLSDGGVHSHINHLKGLCDAAGANGLTSDQVFIHAFLDGRDTDPSGGVNYVQDLNHFLKKSTGQLASLVGRYYAMDRDNRWERIKVAYDLLTKGIGQETTNPEQTIAQYYENGVTDEFMKPLVCMNSAGQTLPHIQAGDIVICFNFRTDRGREITTALTQKEFPEYDMRPLPLHYITMTNYDESFKNVAVIFDKDNIDQTLGEVLAKHGKTQVRIAETEKYPHVTFFFSGGREQAFDGEDRILIPSPKVATYDLQPEMSAALITEAINNFVTQSSPDFICLNFANPDMVGHTGVFSAVVKAVECVDTCLKSVLDHCLPLDYSFIILADHGNAEYMFNEDKSPNTAHTTNLVPVILIDDTYKTIKSGKLGDIAPTILKLMDVPIPNEMTGNVLV